MQLRRRIELRGIPIARLARRSGISKATIHRILDPADDRDVHVGTLVTLAEVLRCDVVRLLEPLPGEQVIEGDDRHPDELAPADDDV
ncbi:MAG: helix-turn-helix transcriptional regulator [bacterium]